ncbi:hypothetical protein AcW1_001543 [Taiwanofungus camphoratus]|nr:hypothetical protein AcV7_003610 [Antrodia cinnamomea]KAI0938816.1 hypothetical protein AcV5_000417 [Antrodia cinnamomea]KAI0945291.1 hypothetical protein AcW1_001543 [Antrodia cinnamomea]
MLTVLGTVLGLVISFRTSSAYERYTQGRQLWTDIAFTSRTLAQLIWIHVPSERADKDTQERKWTLSAVIEKKSMINLVQAFSVSVKHLLRGEGGVYYEDLYPLVCFLPRLVSHAPSQATDADVLPLWKESGMDVQSHLAAHSLMSGNGSADATTVNGGLKPARKAPCSPVQNLLGEKAKPGDLPQMKFHSSFRDRGKRPKQYDPEMALPYVYSEQPLRPARNPPKETIYDYLPFLQIFKLFALPFNWQSTPSGTTTSHAAGRSLSGRKLPPEAIDSNVSHEIALHLSSYFAWLVQSGLIQPVLAGGMYNAITSLQETVANLERIRNTPLPFAYQAHLRISVWLYLFLLPFQVYDAFGYLTIPATAFAAFLYLGFLEIGQEIENPFNYDLNDLDLDEFCLSIERELHEITAHTAPDPGSYIFSAWNQPFAPADRRNALEMLNDDNHLYHSPENGVLSIRQTLLQGWRDVDRMTRKH